MNTGSIFSVGVKSQFLPSNQTPTEKKSKLYVCSFSIRAKKRGSLFFNTSHISLSLLHRKIHTSPNCRACVSAHDWRRCSSPCTWPRCSDHDPVRTAPDPPQMWNMWFPTPWSKIGNRIFRILTKCLWLIKKKQDQTSKLTMQWLLTEKWLIDTDLQTLMPHF